MNIKIDLIHYKGEADNLLNKKYTLSDFLNGTRKEDKKRLEELGAYDKGKERGPIYSAEGIIGQIWNYKDGNLPSFIMIGVIL